MHEHAALAGGTLPGQCTISAATLIRAANPGKTDSGTCYWVYALGLARLCDPFSQNPATSQVTATSHSLSKLPLQPNQSLSSAKLDPQACRLQWSKQDRTAWAALLQ